MEKMGQGLPLPPRAAFIRRNGPVAHRLKGGKKEGRGVSLLLDMGWASASPLAKKINVTLLFGGESTDG